VKFTAIVPTRMVGDAMMRRAKLDGLMKDIAIEAQKQLQEYPPWSPWKRPPKTGLRAGGKRTGTLGSGWGSYQLVSGRSVTLENKTEYAQYVQGRRGMQTRAMEARGWKRVDDVAKDAVKKSVAAFLLRGGL
jgi:hypothetical protein